MIDEYPQNFQQDLTERVWPFDPEPASSISSAANLDDNCPESSDRDVTGGELNIPHPIQCLAPRFGHVGGRNFYHPVVSELTAAVGNDDFEAVHLGTGVVTSITPTSALTFHNKNQQTFCGLSVKTGCVVTGTGPHERAHWMFLEVNPDFYAFGLRSCRYNFESGTRYTPDSIAASISHGIVVSEVKASWSYFWPEEYRNLMDNVERTSEAVGITFNRVVGEQLNADRVRRKNVNRIFRNRFTQFVQRDLESVQNELAKHPETAMGNICEVLRADYSSARAITDALMCKRHLAFDFGSEITPDTIVRAVPAIKNPIDLNCLHLREDDANNIVEPSEHKPFIT